MALDGGRERERENFLLSIPSELLASEGLLLQQNDKKGTRNTPLEVEIICNRIHILLIFRQRIRMVGGQT